MTLHSPLDTYNANLAEHRARLAQANFTEEDDGSRGPALAILGIAVLVFLFGLAGLGLWTAYELLRMSGFIP